MKLINDYTRGKQLTFAIEYREVTRQRLSEKTGIPVSILFEYEKGLKTIPKEHAEILMKKLFFPVEFINKVMPRLFTSWDL